MKLTDSLTPRKVVFFGGLILGAIIIYPNISCLIHDLLNCAEPSTCVPLLIGYFVYRFLFFWFVSWGLLTVNIYYLSNNSLPDRLQKTFFLSVLAYAFYGGIAYAINRFMDCFSGMLVLQFVIAWIISTLAGHIYILSLRQLKIEQENEQLKMETLQSRYEALSNQINPHFFFNSLNSLTALVRCNQKERTLEYINKLSGVFRYILQSEKKGLVTLNDELQFLDAYRYLIEVRYANKISFQITIDEKERHLKIPVLSLLPLIENVIKHNVIDSEHFMVVSVSLNEGFELVVSNPIREKTYVITKTGVGLTNLASRFALLQNKQIRIEKENGVFCVYLPLIEETV